MCESQWLFVLVCIYCDPVMNWRFVQGLNMCLLHLPESEPRLDDQSERPWTYPGLGSLLRKELGLSSSDLFSMTVADYDMKPTVRHSCCC